MPAQTFKKTNYFYIDESGGILNDSHSFILGCTRTDTPELIEESISNLLSGFEDEIYFAPMIADIRRQGFHAVENHFDVRARFFALLPILNFRSFISIINKSKSPFKELIRDNKEKHVYLLVLDKLLKGRFNNRQNRNVFIFEELQFMESNQSKILEEYFSPYMKQGDVSYQIVGKENLGLATTDYMNYIFHNILSAKDLSKVQRMIDNFELVKPKIAFINMMHSDKFLTRKDEYDVEKIRQIYSG
ncbi:MAG: hypothetical protein WCF67_19600 [Chitinophagaceae bacterium]